MEPASGGWSVCEYVYEVGAKAGNFGLELTVFVASEPALSGP